MSDRLVDLTGKVALVTGGARGLGRAISEELARAGADLIIASRKIESCEKACSEIRQAYGRRAVALACHVGKWLECERLAELGWAAFGRIDVLVNNAGMSPVYDDVTSLSEELFDKIIDVNLKGPFRLGGLIGARMQAAGGGAIVNIGSSAATMPLPSSIPYSAAKAGLVAVTQAMAGLFGPQVRVNCVQPGGIATDMGANLTEEMIADWTSGTIAKRFARPEEVAAAVTYLASGAASFTTAAVLRVDGGLPC